MELVGCQIDVPEAVHVVHKKDLSLHATADCRMGGAQVDFVDIAAIYYPPIGLATVISLA